MGSPDKGKPYTLSMLTSNGRWLVRVRCPYCKRTAHYIPEDLIAIYGDVDVDSLVGRMKCESGIHHAYLDVKAISPSGPDALAIKVRRLVPLKIRHVPVWKEE